MNDILNGNLAALWQVFQAPLLGGLAALAGVLAGRWLRWPLLGWASASAGSCWPAPPPPPPGSWR